MKHKLLNYLVCPECKGRETRLEPFIFVKQNPAKGIAKEIKEGLLFCSFGHWFPIINFIPRMTIKEMRPPYKDFIKRYKNEIKGLVNSSLYCDKNSGTKADSRLQVRSCYNYKWGIWPNSVYNKKMTRFFDAWFMRKLGLSDKQDFDRYFRNFNSVLDAGTGLGTKIETIAKRSDAEIIGVDLSGVDYAFENNRKYPNANVVEADIFNLPFKRGVFDFIVSDGVLHHTPEAKRSFLCLAQLLRKGGVISIHVYKRMGPIREFTDDLLRSVSTKLSPQDCYEFCAPFTRLGKALSEMNIKIRIPEDIEPLKIKKGVYDLQRFIYYTFFQCFWNSTLNFKENNIINYDWFHPANASRHYEEEVLGWFKGAKFSKAKSFKTNLSGVSAVGVK